MNNRPIHFEIQADDMKRAKKFYENTFGWKMEKPNMPEVGMEYWMIMTGEGPGINGGLYKRSDNPHPQITTFDCTIQVEDLDKVIKAIKTNGGSIEPWEGKEKWEMKGLGWFSHGVDPEGNIFGLLQPTEWQAK